MLRRDRLDAELDLDTVDAAEVARFEALATEWWNPEGRFKAMHKFNPVRRDYILRATAAYFSRPLQVVDPAHVAFESTPDDDRPAGAADSEPLAGLSVLDIGCGGGLLCEPFARLGARVTGIDATARNIEAARRHAARSGLDIDYRHTLSKELASAGERFDIVLNTEVVEHVANVDVFLGETAAVVAPGGLLFAATLNRTLKSFLIAIVAAEYLLGMLPRGTHAWRKFPKPGELDAHLVPQGLERIAATGMCYRPLRRHWRLCADLSVNYLLTYRRPD